MGASTLLRCIEHGRVALLVMTTSAGGEDRFCAADAWSSGWIEDATWPAEVNQPAGKLPKPNSSLRMCSGPPRADLPVECECACADGWIGPYGAVDPTDGVLRCEACVARGHAVALRPDLLGAPLDVKIGIHAAIESIRPGSALAFVDLLHFKERVNDAYGRATGDRVLRAVGERLRDGLAPLRVLHYKGDEYLIEVDRPLDERGAIELGQRVGRLIAAPIPGIAEPLVARVGITLRRVVNDPAPVFLEVERAAGRAALAGAPFVVETVADASRVWRAVRQIWVQLVSPRFGWVWVQNAANHDYQTWVNIPAGTRFWPPNHVVHGPPVGAYVCDTLPEDDRDDEPWLSFEMIDGCGPLEAGATLEMRPGESGLIAPSNAER